MVNDKEVERWAKYLFEKTQGESWEAVGCVSLLGQTYLKIAKHAVDRHMEVCEQRCRICKEVLIHWCAHCDRS